MPSGGGSAGGGGGGGGGFGGGGGWSSRSRSSFGRYSFRSKSYGTSSGSSEDCDCDCKSCDLPICLLYLAIAGVLILFVAIVIGIPVGVGVASQRPKSDIATNFYSPGDSRLIYLPSFFCDNVHFSVESKATGAAFFLVDSVPPLTDRNNFTINSTDTLPKNNYHFWQYHLYPNSKVTMDVCTDCSRVYLDIYVVKGNENVNRWGDDPGRNHTEVSQTVSAVCSNKNTLVYTAIEEDEYYFIIYNPFDKIELFYDLTLQVERFEYESPAMDVNSTVRDRCAITSGGNCALEIPYSTGSQRALVVTTIPENVDWSENVDIKTSCSRRHWAYAVVVLVPLFVVAAGVAIIVLLMWRCCCSDSGETLTSNDVNNHDNIGNADNVRCTDFDNIDNIDKVDKIDTMP